jgi:hypothetical protein
MTILEQDILLDPWADSLDLTRQIITQYSRVEDPEEQNIDPQP